MKTLIVVEMLTLWAGNLVRAQQNGSKTYLQVITDIGVTNLVPITALGFFLLLAADQGYGEIAALLGAIIAFSYLASSDVLPQLFAALSGKGGR